MKPANLLFILSDEHNRKVMGCSGHPMVKTPNIDRLAAAGTRFSDAYCNSPLCVPSRASLATGRYVHQIGAWDNALPFDGSVPSWHHRLRENGHRVTAIGKLHFRSADDPNGFDEEIMTMHVPGGVGDPMGLVRKNAPPHLVTLKMSESAGRGDSSYQQYDDNITAAGEDWLRTRAGKYRDKPWALFVSLVAPHFPLIARPEWYNLYPEDSIPWPEQYAEDERPTHPWIASMRGVYVYDKSFNEERVRKAIAAYFGLVSFLDHNIGRLLAVLDETGLADTTRVLYSSDHGDNVGARGLWGKSNLYEDSAGVPLILRGPDVPRGVVCPEPVTLVDVFPTVIDCVGLPRKMSDADLPGTSLFDVIRGTKPRRAFSEYHATGAATGAFMIRKGTFKYVYYVDMPPQLFDLENDPWEKRDLAAEPGYEGLLRDCEADLRRVVDPEAADAQAFHDQALKAEDFGGREAILAKGSYGYSPAPGIAAGKHE